MPLVQSSVTHDPLENILIC